MTDARVPDARVPDASLADAASAYLASLDAALSGVDAATRAEIVAGVREELVGLPAEATAERIREIGDPAFVAAEARDALPDALPAERAGEPAASAQAPAAAKAEPACFAVIAGLLVMIGVVVVPVVGALAGYVMVWLSSAWTRRQKVIATAVPVAYFAVLFAVSALVANIAQPASATTGTSGEFHAPLNPLLPTGYDVLWSGILLLGVVQLAVGVWLLAAARRTRMRRAA